LAKEAYTTSDLVQQKRSLKLYAVLFTALSEDPLYIARCRKILDRNTKILLYPVRRNTSPPNITHLEWIRFLCMTQALSRPVARTEIEP